MNREWSIPIVTGLIGVIAGVLFQDALLPKLLKSPISDETVDVFLRTQDSEMIDVFVMNNSDDTLDISQIEVIWNISDQTNGLSAYVARSRLFLIDGSNETRFLGSSDDGGEQYGGTVNTQNTIPPGGRDTLGIKFVDPPLSNVSLVELILETPNGISIRSDGDY